MGKGFFAKIKGASGTAGGKYLVPGLFVVRIEKCKQDKTKEDDDFFAVDLRVLKSSVEDKIAVGSLVSYYEGYKKYPDLAMGNVADFMNNAMPCFMLQNDVEPESMGWDGEVDEDTADDISGEENIIAGTIVKVEAFVKDGKTYTKHRWSPITNEEVDAVLADYPF